MHDQAAVAYLHDTVVVDVEEWAEPPLRPRTPTEPLPDLDQDLTVQIGLDDGYWHRPAAGKAGMGFNGVGHVACGAEVIHRHRHQHRHEEYSGRMCDRGCFSAYELKLAETANQNAEDQRRKDRP